MVVSDELVEGAKQTMLPEEGEVLEASSRIDVQVVLKVNGVRRTLEVDSRMVLLDALRETSPGICGSSDDVREDGIDQVPSSSPHPPRAARRAGSPAMLSSA